MGVGLDITIITGVVLVLIVLVFYFVLTYNGLVGLKNNIAKNWSNIDVLLKQRSQELPLLVDTVRGYMKHEKDVLETLTKARIDIMSAKSVSEKAKADLVISESLKSVFAVAESYPDLKANSNFLKLQDRISGLENEIADRREFFNDSVNNYNIKIESFPDVFIANMLKLEKKDLFSVNDSEKAAVDVKV
ncbi:LemA family protein [Candidatus Tiddalikarchaeum anstoanum]|nr:LemA family protein [Candidatus Tiddalikarchaeum anstoanum]